MEWGGKRDEERKRKPKKNEAVEGVEGGSRCRPPLPGPDTL